MENTDQILEQIRQQNLTLREVLLQSDHQDSDQIVDYTLKLAPLLLDLLNALGRQLESTAKDLQNTRHLLNTLQENGWQQIPTQGKWRWTCKPRVYLLCGGQCCLILNTHLFNFTWQQPEYWNLQLDVIGSHPFFWASNYRCLYQTSFILTVSTGTSLLELLKGRVRKILNGLLLATAAGLILHFSSCRFGHIWWFWFALYCIWWWWL